MSYLKITKEEDALLKTMTSSGNIFLKAKDDTLEIIEIDIKAGKSVFLQPYECANAMYFFYVLSGSLFHKKTLDTLIPGDCISAKDISETEFFEVPEDTKLLIVTQKNFFNTQSNYFDKLSNELELIQKKDHYTMEHCNRTGNLALQIGIEMNLCNQPLEDLVCASKIHDIGKINIPDHILNKPGKYTDSELEIMKQHSIDGYNKVFGFVNDKESQIVCQHHEKVNGSGYPYGLKGDEILLESRILAVADAYDALTSDRPYRKALTKEDAFDLLWKDRDVLWDLDVLKALEKVCLKHI